MKEFFMVLTGTCVLNNTVYSTIEEASKEVVMAANKIHPELNVKSLLLFNDGTWTDSFCVAQLITPYTNFRILKFVLDD